MFNEPLYLLVFYLNHIFKAIHLNVEDLVLTI
jgi:hypothetical protein